MKKLVVLFVMVFAFSLTQANNLVVARTVRHNQTMVMQNEHAMLLSSQQMMPMGEMGVFAHQFDKTKTPKADRKPKTKKAKKEHRATHPHHAKTKTEHQHHNKTKAEHQHHEKTPKAHHHNKKQK